MENLGEIEVYILLFGGIAVMLFLAVFIILSFMLYQRKVMLKNQQILQIQNAYQRDLLQASLQSEEKERIARDLHDEIGAMLSTTKLYLAQAKSKQTIADAHSLSDKANELINQTIQNMRAISKDLSPAVLTNFGIVHAMRDLVSHVQESKMIAADCECEEEIPRFDKMKELMLYRIAQELVNNSLKHAQAKHLRLHLRSEEGKYLCFVYQDDGKGFDMEKMKAKRGLGLKNIESRGDLLGGTTNFTSKENEGVRFEVRFATSP